MKVLALKFNGWDWAVVEFASLEEAKEEVKKFPKDYIQFRFYFTEKELDSEEFLRLFRDE